MFDAFSVVTPQYLLMQIFNGESRVSYLLESLFQILLPSCKLDAFSLATFRKDRGTA